MATDRERAQREMEREAEGIAAGPGTFVTRSQARGTGAGFLLGLFAGALVGLVTGIVVFQGKTGAIVITIISFAFAGVVAGHLIGGSLRSRDVSERETADAPGAEYDGPVTKPES